MASKSAQRWVNCLLVVLLCLGALPAVALVWREV